MIITWQTSVDMYESGFAPIREAVEYIKTLHYSSKLVITHHDGSAVAITNPDTSDLYSLHGFGSSKARVIKSEVFALYDGRHVPVVSVDW